MFCKVDALLLVCILDICLPLHLSIVNEGNLSILDQILNVEFYLWLFSHPGTPDSLEQLNTQEMEVSH